MLNILLNFVMFYLVFGVITLMIISAEEIKNGVFKMGNSVGLFKVVLNAIKIIFLWFPLLILQALN